MYCKSVSTIIRIIFNFFKYYAISIIAIGWLSKDLNCHSLNSNLNSWNSIDSNKIILHLALRKTVVNPSTPPTPTPQKKKKWLIFTQNKCRHEGSSTAESDDKPEYTEQVEVVCPCHGEAGGQETQDGQDQRLLPPYPNIKQKFFDLHNDDQYATKQPILSYPTAFPAKTSEKQNTMTRRIRTV